MSAELQVDIERRLPSEAESARPEPREAETGRRELPAPGGVELGGWSGGSTSGAAGWEGAHIVDVDDEQEEEGDWLAQVAAGKRLGDLVDLEAILGARVP